jgi:hypothetical protein
MDTYVSEILAVINSSCCDDLDKVVQELTKAGMNVTEINKDDGVIGGTIETSKLAQLESNKAVDYVRTVFTYNAHFEPTPIKRAG